MNDGPEEIGKAPAGSGDRHRWKARWGQFEAETRDNILVGFATLVWVVLFAILVFKVITDAASRPGNLTILGGMIGLMLASYAVMSNRLHAPMRLPIAIVGIGLIVACWGFGRL